MPILFSLLSEPSHQSFIRISDTGAVFNVAGGAVATTPALYRSQSSGLACSASNVLARVRAVWLRMAPQVPFPGKSADSPVERYDEADERDTRLFGIGAGFAVLIGCVGLCGLASCNTQRRIREIGIRKTLSASSADIVRLPAGQFLRRMLIANLVAWPLAFVAMRTWPAAFDYRIGLSPL